MAGVMRASRSTSTPHSARTCVLAGPAVTASPTTRRRPRSSTSASRRWRALPHATRARVHLACVPDGRPRRGGRDRQRAPAPRRRRRPEEPGRRLRPHGRGGDVEGAPGRRQRRRRHRRPDRRRRARVLLHRRPARPRGVRRGGRAACCATRSEPRSWAGTARARAGASSSSATATSTSTARFSNNSPNEARLVIQLSGVETIRRRAEDVLHAVAGGRNIYDLTILRAERPPSDSSEPAPAQPSSGTRARRIVGPRP